jgi:hypothetical protein
MTRKELWRFATSSRISSKPFGSEGHWGSQVKDGKVAISRTAVQDLALGRPHSALMIPCIVGFPDLETDGEVTPRSGDENPFTGMRNIHSGHDENFLANGSVNQNSVAYLHGVPALSVALPHSLKLAFKGPSCNLK